MDTGEDHVYTVLFQYTKALSVALGYRDLLTRLHSQRVLRLAEEMGECCGLSTKDIGILKVGASFHDIGKIGIPDQILLKPGQLDTDEWDQMKLHAEIGEQILAATELEGAEEAALAIRHHHEHFDGTGYPDGLAGEAAPLLSRIISITDGYDAMAITRTYHRPRSHPEIMHILHEECGSKYDPRLMCIFDAMIERSKFKAGKN